MAAVVQKEELQKLLQNGTSLAEAATHFGVTASAITQAVESAGLQVGASGTLEEKHKKLDNTYDALEQKVLDKLEAVIPFQSDPMKLARLVTTLNMAKRRGGVHTGDTNPTAPHVTVILPSVVQNKLQLSQNREVISVDGRDMVTMPAASVKTLADVQVSDTKKEPSKVNKLSSLI